MNTADQPSDPPRMYRRRYKLRKPTPKLPAGVKILFDPFRGDYTNDPLATRVPRQGMVVERFSLTEVENPEWFEPDSDLIPFRPPMIPPGHVSSRLDHDGCVLVTVESRHNDMCDFCRNARTAIIRTDTEVLSVAYEILKRNYEAGHGQDTDQLGDQAVTG